MKTILASEVKPEANGFAPRRIVLRYDSETKEFTTHSQNMQQENCYSYGHYFPCDGKIVQILAATQDYQNRCVELGVEANLGL